MENPLPESARLHYRPFSKPDIHFAIEYLSDPDRTRYLPNEAPYPIGLAVEWAAKRITHWERHGFGTFVLHLDLGQAPIGFCGLEHALGSDFIDIRYGLLQSAWGKGLALEAAKAIIDYGFNCLKLETIYGAAVPENRPSIEILKKLGMGPDPAFNVYGDVVDSFSISA